MPASRACLKKFPACAGAGSPRLAAAPSNSPHERAHESISVTRLEQGFSEYAGAWPGRSEPGARQGFQRAERRAADDVLGARAHGLERKVAVQLRHHARQQLRRGARVRPRLPVRQAACALARAGPRAGTGGPGRVCPL